MDQSEWTRGGVTTSKPNDGRYGQSGHPTDMHQGHLPIGGERGAISDENEYVGQIQIYLKTVSSITAEDWLKLSDPKS